MVQWICSEDIVAFKIFFFLWTIYFLQTLFSCKKCILSSISEFCPKTSKNIWKVHFWSRTFLFVLRATVVLILGGFICNFSLLISLSFTFQSSKFNYSSSHQCCQSRTGISNESVQVSFHYFKRDRTRRCFLF